jgi:hypothetical protein
MKRKVILLAVALGLVVIGLLISLYFIYFFMTTCDSQNCFNNALGACKRSTYLSNDGQTAIEYDILGKESGKCKIEVKLLQMKTGSIELAVLEGKDMTCLTPIGVLVDPEKNLKYCHGTLKEEIQNIIIQRMHAQIVQNIGKIENETTNVI